MSGGTEFGLSTLQLISQASVAVQGVMVTLFLMSIVSWAVIFSKWVTIRRTARGSAAFESRFWSGIDLHQLYQQAQQRVDESIGIERIFSAGFRELLKLKKQNSVPMRERLDNVQRAMRAENHRELERMETHLTVLATTGSVSPYIGLFGTVWGIMNAFRGLADVGQATLAHVAPGISEALIATAIGLFAAIPAVVAYNRYVYDIDRLAMQMDRFIDEFSNVLQRQTAP